VRPIEAPWRKNSTGMMKLLAADWHHIKANRIDDVGGPGPPLNLKEQVDCQCFDPIQQWPLV